MFTTNEVILSDYQEKVYQGIKLQAAQPTLMYLGIRLFGYNDPMVSHGLYEELFHILYPSLKAQVVFGTGKGGYAKYGLKKFTADFYDEDTRTIYEIDGPEHDYGLHKLKDKRRDLVAEIAFGIKTVRFSNQEVVDMVRKRIKEVIPSE